MLFRFQVRHNNGMVLAEEFMDFDRPTGVDIFEKAAAVLREIHASAADHSAHAELRALYKLHECTDIGMAIARLDDTRPHPVIREYVYPVLEFAHRIDFYTATDGARAQHARPETIRIIAAPHTTAEELVASATRAWREAALAFSNTDQAPIGWDHAEVVYGDSTPPARIQAEDVLTRVDVWLRDGTGIYMYIPAPNAASDWDVTRAALEEMRICRGKTFDPASITCFEIEGQAIPLGYVHGSRPGAFEFTSCDLERVGRANVERAKGHETLTLVFS